MQLEDYQPRWSEDFLSLANPLSRILGDNLTAIYHIGSTAVPGLCAKPVIDVMPVVFELSAVDHLQTHLEGLGYRWRHENGMAGRRYLTRDQDRQGAQGSLASDRQPHPLLPGCHVHIFDAFSPEVEKHLAFRDALRRDLQLRDRYAAVKRDLAQRLPRDRKSYQSGKAPFIASLTAEALAGEGSVRLPIQVCVWITSAYQGKRHYLLLKRSPDAGGFWQGVTGAPYPTESLSEAAAREVLEETAITCPHAPCPIGVRYKFPVSPEWKKSYRPEVLQIVEEVFRVELPAKSQPELSTEHVEWKWVDAATAVPMLRWPNNVAALRVLDKT